MNLHTIDELRDLQDMDLFSKVAMTEERLHEWQYQAPWGVEKGVVSFSGGKDSTVLLHIARSIYPDIPAVFSNTGLEYPEIQSFVKRQKNVTIVRPKMKFSEVISKFGYPLISKEVAEIIRSARKNRGGHDSERARKRLRGELLQENGKKSAYNVEKYGAIAQKIPVFISKRCCDVMKKAR